MVQVKKRVVLLGSTGSIGTQALEVIAENPDRFELIGLAARGSDPELMVSQARKFALSAGQVAVASERSADILDAELGGRTIRGNDSARQLVQAVSGDLSEDDVVLNALVGSLGLDATLATLSTPAKLALANKESLVAGGELVLRAADPGQLIPVDSEHSAMAQCLRSGTEQEVARLLLTASGGPFRGWTASSWSP